MDNKNSKNRLIRRLHIVAGQVKGIEKMVEQDKYCVDIITQSLAVKEALSGIENIILEKHLSTHVVKQMRTNQAPKAIREILKIHRLSKRK
jgi:DNA-binding FrmR family transcriptional regulator